MIRTIGYGLILRTPLKRIQVLLFFFTSHGCFFFFFFPSPPSVTFSDYGKRVAEQTMDDEAIVGDIRPKIVLMKERELVRHFFYYVYSPTRNYHTTLKPK